MSRRRKLGNDTVGSAKLHRYHSVIAYDLTATIPDKANGFLHILDIEPDVVNPGPSSHRGRLVGRRAWVVADQGNIDASIGQVA